MAKVTQHGQVMAKVENMAQLVERWYGQYSNYYTEHIKAKILC